MAYTMKQNDTRPIYIAQLKDNFGTVNETPIDLSAGGTTVKFIMRKQGEMIEKVNASAAMVTASQGVVSYTWQPGDTDEAGIFDAEFQITWADGGVETVPNTEYLEIVILDDLG